MTAQPRAVWVTMPEPARARTLVSRIVEQATRADRIPILVAYESERPRAVEYPWVEVAGLFDSDEA